MPKFERVKDKWKPLRKGLFGNSEPSVELRAITMPVNKIIMPGFGYINRCESVDKDGFIGWEEIEQLPAISAGVSYGATEKLENDSERAIKLNKKLISQKHFTPFEIVQYAINIKGLSKAAGAQLSRYRHSGHISRSRRFVTAGPAYVYPILDNIDYEDFARERYQSWSKHFRSCQNFYEYLRSPQPSVKGTGCTPEEWDKTKSEYVPMTKEQARGVIPVFSSTERTMWVNVRSLRHIFDERLRADTESELRRLIWMIWDLVEPLSPSFYFDLKEEMDV
jgi:flavin-dependent thymidylate synthase